MNRIIVFVLCLILIVFAISFSPAGATRLGPRDLREIERNADAVVVGKVTQLKLERPLGISVSIDRVLKGNAQLAGKTLDLDVEKPIIVEDTTKHTTAIGDALPGSYGVMFLSEKYPNRYELLSVSSTINYLLPALPGTHLTDGSPPLMSVAQELAAVLSSSEGVRIDDAYGRTLRALYYVPYDTLGPPLAAIVRAPDCNSKGRLFAIYLLIMKDDWTYVDLAQDLLLHPAPDEIYDARGISAEMSASIDRKHEANSPDWIKSLPSVLQKLAGLLSSTDDEVRSDAASGLSRIKHLYPETWKKWADSHPKDVIRLRSVKKAR